MAIAQGYRGLLPPARSTRSSFAIEALQVPDSFSVDPAVPTSKVHGAGPIVHWIADEGEKEEGEDDEGVERILAGTFANFVAQMFGLGRQQAAIPNPLLDIHLPETQDIPSRRTPEEIARWRTFFQTTYEPYLVSTLMGEPDKEAEESLLQEAEAIDPKGQLRAILHAAIQLHNAIQYDAADPGMIQDSMHAITLQFDRLLEPFGFMTEVVMCRGSLKDAAGYMIYELKYRTRYSLHYGDTPPFTRAVRFWEPLTRLDVLGNRLGEHGGAAGEEVENVYRDQVRRRIHTLLSFAYTPSVTLAELHYGLSSDDTELSLRDVVNRLPSMLTAEDYEVINRFSKVSRDLQEAIPDLLQVLPSLIPFYIGGITLERFEQGVQSLSWFAGWSHRSSIKHVRGLLTEAKEESVRISAIAPRIRDQINTDLNDRVKELVRADLETHFSHDELRHVLRYTTGMAGRALVQGLLRHVNEHLHHEQRPEIAIPEQALDENALVSLVAVQATLVNCEMQAFESLLRTANEQWAHMNGTDPSTYEAVMDVLTTLAAEKTGGHEFLHAYNRQQATDAGIDFNEIESWLQETLVNFPGIGLFSPLPRLHLTEHLLRALRRPESSYEQAPWVACDYACATLGISMDANDGIVQSARLTRLLDQFKEMNLTDLRHVLTGILGWDNLSEAFILDPTRVTVHSILEPHLLSAS